MNYEKHSKIELDEKLKEKFEKASKFCDGDLSKVLLLLLKGLYPNKNMNSLRKLNKILLPNIGSSYSSLSL